MLIVNLAMQVDLKTIYLKVIYTHNLLYRHLWILDFDLSDTFLVLFEESFVVGIDIHLCVCVFPYAAFLVDISNFWINCPTPVGIPVIVT